MLTPEEVAEAVRADVEEGLGRSFEPHEDEVGAGWSVADVFADIEPMTNGSFTTVPWQYRCRHTGWFQGAAPTGNALTIRGTTVVDHRSDEALFHRHVDWLAVMYALGYDLYLRELVPAVDRDAANFGPDGP